MNPAVIFDAGLFLVLLALSELVRRYAFRRDVTTDTTAMGLVMAIGIFVAYSLPQLPFGSPLLVRVTALELLVIWLYTAGFYVRSAMRGDFIQAHVASPLGRFGIGTWVAGTGVVAALVANKLPALDLIAGLLTVVTVTLYLPYLVLFVHGYCRLWRHPRRQHANGVILLATVSTQSLLIACISVFHPDVPEPVSIGLFVFDLFFLLSGIALIAINFHAVDAASLAAGWKNANCIVHGAVSITGLGLLLTLDFNPWTLFHLWKITLVLFVVIEIVELVRASMRGHAFGLGHGLAQYNTTQWTRNFTFGMFYAFSLCLSRQLAGNARADASIWAQVLGFVVQWGQWAVLALLLIELALFLRYRLRGFNAA